MKEIKFEVLCDVCKRYKGVDIENEDGSIKTEEEVKEELRYRGWVIEGDEWVCERCASGN